MKKIVLFSALVLMLSATSCNYFARKMGGTQNIELNPGEKFVNVTFKDNDIWVLVKDTTKSKTYIFKEYSNLGVLEGQVIITEK